MEMSYLLICPSECTIFYCSLFNVVDIKIKIFQIHVRSATIQTDRQTHESQRRIRNIKERVRKILVLQKKTFWLSCLKSRPYVNKNRCEVRFPFCASQILLEIRDDCSYKSTVC
jgi:hypothetical protein